MNAYENGVAVGVGDCNSCWQRNENVAVPRHHYVIAIGGEDISKPLRHVERHVFFRDPLPGNSPTIMTTMSRIDNYSGQPAVVSRRRIGIAGCQNCDQQACKKIEPAKICRHH
jgi:hypothetical protein